jgi:hypothetical protein
MRLRRIGRRARFSWEHDMTRAGPSDGCEVAVIGAGPYGLAVAAHLRSAKIGTRVFGRPMSFWREHMPKGMRLRSPWIATHIADPGKRFSLDMFARQTALPAQDQRPIEHFVQYGDWFARQVVPDLDQRKVLRVENAEPGFRLVLEDEDGHGPLMRFIAGAGYAGRSVTRSALARRRWAKLAGRDSHGGYRAGAAQRMSHL